MHPSKQNSLITKTGVI